MAGPDHNIFPAGNWGGKKIGLLGGSFNPAHGGHVEISRTALDRLELDAVWWLVSPQNPLKSETGMAPYDQRLEGARAAARDERIYVSDLEHHLGTRYTVDTLSRIKTRLPDSHFVWLMGADNLVRFSQWKDWQKIGNMVVFAIFNRPGYSETVDMSKAAGFFRDDEIPADQAAKLCRTAPPAWTFIRETSNPLSSTELRQKNVY